MTTSTKAWATPAADAPLAPTTIERRDLLATDVRIAIEFCGICHTDVHYARDEWHRTVYPCVPGHEIVGRVVEVGAAVTAHRPGDRVGVGCLVDSCGTCAECRAGLENYCAAGPVLTYNGVDAHGTAPRTLGGYSGEIVVTERFVLRIPDGLDPAAAAPLLCAGITTYSPLRHHAVGAGSAVGVAGFGGLGSLGVKIAKAMGARVTVLTRSAGKADVARKAGADDVVVMGEHAQVKRVARSLDLILSTIPTSHDLDPYLGLLRRDGVYVVLGAIEPITEPVHGGRLTARRLSISGSMIGGIPETQQVLDFCAAHGIASDVEVIGVDSINGAYDRLTTGDPGFRFVVDMSTL